MNIVKSKPVNKIFILKRYEDQLFSEEEIIEMIENEKIDEEDLITSLDLKYYYPLNNTIFKFYLQNKKS